MTTARWRDAGLAVPSVALAVWLLWLHGTWPVLGVVCVVATAAVAPTLARIDWSERRLPNPITLPLGVLGLAAAAWEAIAGRWVAPLVALGVVVLLVLLAATAGLGMGDVKLGGAIALGLSPFDWWVPFAALAAAFILGGVVGIVGLTRGEKSLPFGPWLLAGGCAALALAAVH